jgi:para-aminobenzoate synthetase component 1
MTSASPLICRFEDRGTGRARLLSRLRERIVATTPDELAPALAYIATAQAAGRWVGLLLDYELGEWLEPAVMQNVPPRVAAPRLTALVFDEMHDTDALPGCPDADAEILSVTPRVAQADYLRTVEEIHTLIGDGDVYQINHTLPLDVQTRGEPADLYARLAARQTASHAAFIDDRADGGRAVLSFSPERFVRRRGTRIESRPMKGTAPRSTDPVEDRRLADALLASEKNRAENVMIVDLIRNDLGRIARPGSVKVDALFTLEAYPQVWTLTSTVSAELADTSLAGMLHALFPCGSITGAPKVAAMRHIRRLEPSPRGLYCGALGWLAPDGDFDLSVTIRTLVLDRNGAGVYGVGGGIVYDSDPREEWEECLWKARVLTT